MPTLSGPGGGPQQPPPAPKPPNNVAPIPASDSRIPGWENQQLNQLYQSGQLYGVDPQILAGIDQAESSGQGGSINPQGYGGFFGLGANSTYPGGQSSPGLLQGTSQQAFDQQAQLAANDFAGLMNSYGGNIYEAEQAYQQGGQNAGSYATNPGEGDSVFAALGLPQTIGTSGYQSALGGAISSGLGAAGAGAALQNAGGAQTIAVGGAQEQLTQQEIQQQLQNSLASLGIQRTGLGQQQAYQQGQYGYTQQQQALQKLQEQQAYQQQMEGLSQGAAGAGTTDTGSYRQGHENISLAYQNALKGLGIQAGQSALSNTYSSQQLQNALAQLGIQQTEAQQNAASGNQSAILSYANLVNQTAVGGISNDINATQNGLNTINPFLQTGFSG